MPILLPAYEECSRAASLSGCEIRQIIKKSADYISGSWTYGEPSRQALSELIGLFNECTQPNWDGYDAPALKPQVFEYARQFIATVPLDLPNPEISASPQGDISFEWYQGPKQIVSVGVSESGEIHFASLSGYRRVFGSYPFDGTFDDQIYGLIHDLYEVT